ncbi:hypothetical protein ASPACDRAFT_1858145 [Aspergillus aculeatus ATCC 16872]|uniref:Luciferase domain-containing protein n=1 Tax=Aspergillus aculeatus (strain ATCC 16872 / CBS 172.66 / WB 5094) TaxID=690307 RepID=A0A1L9WPP9_ASPA1|nr:uncharacterized protein ASPACDRAFT_1858145 [Aspergillus aculeatus ATCC 16872]OJJ98134.1 hypothetical protein ASPACDRAFT_1858145 [Aspergillus aculeatus ATCC 16872]
MAALSTSSKYVFETLKSNLVVTGLCVTAIVGLVWTVNDFREWKAFGTGGTPPTWAGYMRMSKLRARRALTKNNNLRDPAPLQKTGPSYLPTGTLPLRSGPRPRMMPRTLPQRQYPEPIDPSVQARLRALVRDLATAHPELFDLMPSHTEGRTTDGLYARRNLPTLNPLAGDRILSYEIAHMHPAENSLHVWLSDVDAREVIEKGWGQRFPLPAVPQGWVMVYAPRDEGEMDIVEGVVRAAARWVTGVMV